MTPTILKEIQAQGIIPVLVIEQISQALPLVDALAAGGLKIIEVTLRTAAALPAIREICHQRSDLVIGAGTVLTREQTEQAVECGVRFLVSPGLDKQIIRYANSLEIPMLAGAVTASEIMRGLKLNLSVFKFFPAEAMGGIKTIHALADPFPAIQFIPTGGINQNNLETYLQHARVLAVGGSWMARPEWIADEQWQKITDTTRVAMDVVRKVRCERG